METQHVIKMGTILLNGHRSYKTATATCTVQNKYVVGILKRKRNLAILLSQTSIIYLVAHGNINNENVNRCIILVSMATSALSVEVSMVLGLEM